MGDDERRAPESGGSDAGAAPWYLGGAPAPAADPVVPPRAAPGLDAPPPWGGPTTPVTPLHSVGPQPWLAQDVPLAEAEAPPGPPPPSAIPGTPTWQAAGAAPAPADPWADRPSAPLVTARPSRKPIALFVAAAVALAVVVAGGLLVSGRFSLSTDPGAASGVDASGDTGKATGGKTDTAAGTASAGPLQPVSVTATCQAPPGVDSAGNTITYEPELTLDAVGATAWRCAGSAVGQQLVYDFGQPVTVTAVALVPGYAKVDPADGTDRFLENRTVTAATWIFDDGSARRQTIAAPSPSVAELELDGGVVTRRLVLQIDATGNDSAVRDFTAISDVRFTGS